MGLFKGLISPIQKRILDHKMCPACTRSLDNQDNRQPITTEMEMVFCECGRAYVYSRLLRKYRRALPQEVQATTTRTVRFY
jgi:hypothetical protein